MRARPAARSERGPRVASSRYSLIMGVLVSIETPTGERTWGLLLMCTVERSEWHVQVCEVPRVATFCFADVVAVDAVGATVATQAPRRFSAIVERGGYQSSLRVTHSLSNAESVDRWLEGLEAMGWATRDGSGRSVVWVAAPTGIDGRSVLRSYSWVTGVSASPNP